MQITYRHHMSMPIAAYFSCKLLASLAMFLLMPVVFGQSVFHFDDFTYYSSVATSVGPNIGYRALIALLSIQALDEPLPIFLAIAINLAIDISWILLLGRAVGVRVVLYMAVIMGLQPYAAVYTMKFSSILFAKLGALCFFYLLQQSRQESERIFGEVKGIASWAVLVLLRNSNVFLAIPYFLYRYRFRPVFAGLLVIVFSVSVYVLSEGYLAGLSPVGRPWDLNYVQTLYGVDSVFLSFLLLLVSRVLLLFGAREKLYCDGLEPFLVVGISGLELIVYVIIGVVQLFGYLLAMKYLVANYGRGALIFCVPLVLAIFSVSHQRYLIPFIPICAFGLAVYLNRLFGMRND